MKPIEEIHPTPKMAGNIVERLVAEIPETEIVSKIREMLNASYVTKSGKEHPDYRAREAGIKLYLSYTVGLPLQRQIMANVNQERPSEEAEWSRILTSPAARRVLKARLIEAGEEM